MRAVMSRASRPDDLLDRQLPDLVLPDQRGEPFSVRQFVGEKPFVLFCYILNGTPG